jgi:hypothetical protein
VDWQTVGGKDNEISGDRIVELLGSQLTASVLKQDYLQRVNGRAVTVIERSCCA